MNAGEGKRTIILAGEQNGKEKTVSNKQKIIWNLIKGKISKTD